MSSNQLTTLANVSAWLGGSVVSDGPLLTRLISAASRFILSYLSRPTLFQYAYSDVYDGVGQNAQVLRHYPVVSVSSVTIRGHSVPASSGYPQYGYVLDAWDGLPPGRSQRITMQGQRFPQDAPQSVAISYTAGYVVQNEAQTVPGSGYQVTVNAPYGNWGADQGVTYANGAALTAISSGTPATGQYVPPNGTNSYYQFAAGDANASMLISYSYIPSDVEQACIEMVAERYNYKNRIGLVSKSLGGQETMSYSQKNMSDFVKSLLNPYRRVVPV